MSRRESVDFIRERSEGNQEERRGREESMRDSLRRADVVKRRQGYDEIEAMQKELVRATVSSIEVQCSLSIDARFSLFLHEANVSRRVSSCVVQLVCCCHVRCSEMCGGRRMLAGSGAHFECTLL